MSHTTYNFFSPPSHPPVLLPTSSASSTSSSSIVDTPPSPLMMSSIPLQPTTPDAALEAHGNDIAASPSSSPTKLKRSPMTPADVRTLKKILTDVQTLSPAASSVMQHEDKGLSSVDISEDGSSDTGIEDEVQYTDKQFGYGNELDEGYEDEDESMDLSDEGVYGNEAGGSALLDDDEREYVWSDGDTVEDIMNAPGQTAPSARPQHLDGVYQHKSPTLDEIKEISLQRAALEDLVQQERLNQEHREAIFVEDETFLLAQATMEEQDDAVGLSDDSEFQALQTAQAQTGLSRIEEDEEPEVELEYFEPNDRRTSRLFSGAPISRRASEDALPISSFHGISDPRPAVVATPSGHHLAFTPISTISVTPFNKALKYAKQSKGKENSPAKSRRNASLPEEIKEVARQANEDEDLDKYRDFDLAPMEPVMESESAGDLITFGTPAKSNIPTPPINPATPSRVTQRSTSVAEPNTTSDAVSPKPTAVGKDLDALDTSGSADSQKNLSEALSCRPSSPVKQDEGNAENSDIASGSKHEQLIPFPERPTFVNVIAILPEAMFWATAAPVLKYSNMAYEAMVSQFTNLDL